MKKFLVSIDISLGGYQYFIDEILSLSLSGKSAYVCVANVHMLVEAKNDPSFAENVNTADMVTPDGMPLTWGLKLIYNIHQERVAGMDLLPDLLTKASLNSIPVFFYGGTQVMLDQTYAFIKSTYPSLNWAGSYSPPFRALTVNEENNVVDMINGSGAKMVFVALGCPKQEKWMASMKGKINATMIGIGGALPVLIGMHRRAPNWMRNYSLEWLYRLSQEPKRLFKRYAVTNSSFLYLLAREFLNKHTKTI